MFYQTFCLFDDHFSNLDVPRGWLVKSRTNDLAVDRTLHIRDLFGPLVDQKYNQHYLFMIVGNSFGDMLQHHSFTSSWCGNDEATLTFANGSQEINDSRGVILRLILESQTFVWI